jgi:hypothetical protein
MSANLEASLRLDIAQYQQQLAKAKGEAKKLRSDLQSQGGFGKAFSGLGGQIAGIAGAAGFGLLVKRGLEFNQTIGDSETAIAQVLRQFKGLSTEAAKGEAAAAMQAMVDLEPSTAASLTGLVDGFLATLGSSQAVGIDVAQNIDLVGKFANAMANAKIPAEQLAQEMRSIVSGNIGADSTLAKVLSISNADIEKARQAGTLYDFLVGKIGTLGEAGDTAGVAFSTLSSAMDKAAGLLTEGLFAEGVQGAKEMATFLEQNADLFRDLGQGIAFATKESIKLLAELNNIRNSLTQGVGEGIGKLLGLDPAGGTVAQTNKEARDQASASDAAARFGPAKQFDSDGKEIVKKDATTPEKKPGTPGTSAPDAKALIEAHREIARLQQQEASLNQKRFDDYLSILPPNLQLIEIKREQMRLEAESAALTGPGFDEQRLQIATELLDLQKQTRTAESDIADEKKRAADEAADDLKEAQEKAALQADAIAAFDAEMALINAKLTGNKELTAELERQAAIEQEKNRLIAAGVTEADAAAKASQIVDARQSLMDKPTGPDGKIKGYSRERQGGADEARQRAEDRVTASRTRRDSAVTDAFGTLRPTGAAAAGTNPLAAAAQKNASAEGATPQDSNAAAAQIVTQMLPQIVSILSGS